ncbi:hypothetical protein GCM10029964_055980 [Kibdelosporangium lantanae]
MASVSLPVADVERLLAADFGGAGLSVAAVNGPRSVVVSGARGVLEILVDACGRRGVRARLVDVDYASHHSDVDVVGDELVGALEGLGHGSRSEAVMWSTVTGAVVGSGDLNGEYWLRNLRDRVCFDDVLRDLVATGSRRFVEISPHPVLLPAIQDRLDDAGVSGVVCESVRRGDDGATRLLLSLGRAWVHGMPVSWHGLLEGGRLVDVPTYPFQHEHYWLTSDPPAVAKGGDDVEQALWDAIERQDVDEVTATLGIAVDDNSGLASTLDALSTWRRRRREKSTADGWRYRQTWHPVAHDQQVRLPGVWLVLVPHGRRGHQVVASCLTAMTAVGREARTLDVDPASVTRADLVTVLRAGIGSVAFAGIVSLLAVEDTRHPVFPSVPLGVSATVALVQALGDVGTTAPLWCVTSGAVSTGQSDVLSSPDQALVWGMGRTVAVEHPDRWGGLVDVPHGFGGGLATQFAAALTNPSGEDELAVRPAGLVARRLVRATRSPQPSREFSMNRDGTTMITGARVRWPDTSRVGWSPRGRGGCFSSVAVDPTAQQRTHSSRT